MDRACQVVQGDQARFRISGDDIPRVPDGAVASEQEYRRFLATLQTEVSPAWAWTTHCEVRRDAGGFLRLFVQFVNTSNGEPSEAAWEPFIFDPKAHFDFLRPIAEPFEFERVPRSFRYHRELSARGFNCAVNVGATPRQTFETTHVPRFSQPRLMTATEPGALFNDLVADPLPVLARILEAMQRYRATWEEYRRRYSESVVGWEEFEAEYARDQDCFEQESQRFQLGLECLQSNPDALLAFTLTNEVFRRAGDHTDPNKRKVSWRLFQIVFLVTQVPGTVALAVDEPRYRQERSWVDIVYFPTGGGKTEAYLGALVFHCFFDRLRGKAAGVTAWTRFPLRLLTLQQTQRLADVIGIAELVRREQQDTRLLGKGIAGFAVGYFVGQTGSPNELVDPDKEPRNRAKWLPTWTKANDAAARQAWRRVVRCPSCRTLTVQLDFDLAHTRLIHRCTNDKCAFPEGQVPVYIVDNEVYRYLPTIVVGTIDKLASVGNQRKMSMLLGQIDGRCREHGYYKGICCQRGCDDKSLLQVGAPRGLSGPTLLVQDELHLLKEGLGTFDGHYETFLQRLRAEFGDRHPLKVIASSATIEAFERQSEHLYQREARIFPGFGPALGRSFYAEVQDYSQRMFAGVIPHNKTIFNAILELLELYHRVLQQLKSLGAGATNPYGGAVTTGSSDWMRLLDYYATSLTYFLAQRELSSIQLDIEGDVSPNLQADGLTPLTVKELTGSTDTDTVTQVLEHLETPAPGKSQEDAVLATSMVSHGVDIDRLNGMIFYGMPRQTAEYIQASSRVGRSHVGLVICCLHPVRERDRSHYNYFSKYHEYLGMLVEPVAINRWSRFSVTRTLPGLFMGYLLQVASQRVQGNPNLIYFVKQVRKMLNDGLISRDELVAFLKESYGVSAPQGPAESAFSREIENGVRRFIAQINIASPNVDFLSSAIAPAPMNSLRDVDEAIPISLDDDGSQWSTRLGAQRDGDD